MKHTRQFSVGLVICYLYIPRSQSLAQRSQTLAVLPSGDQPNYFFSINNFGVFLWWNSFEATKCQEDTQNHGSVVKSEVVQGFRRRRRPSASASPFQPARAMHSALFCLYPSFSTSSRASMNINCVPGTRQTPAERLEWVILSGNLSMLPALSFCTAVALKALLQFKL